MAYFQIFRYSAFIIIKVCTVFFAVLFKHFLRFQSGMDLPGGVRGEGVMLYLMMKQKKLETNTAIIRLAKYIIRNNYNIKIQ